MIFYVDGGYDNIRKQNGYGSFAAYAGETEISLVRFDLPEVKSNNEAEYMSLLKLLEWIDVNGLSNEPNTILTDSRLMVNQISGEWKVKAENLKPFLAMVHLPEKTELKWITRKVIVKILGH